MCPAACQPQPHKSPEKKIRVQSLVINLRLWTTVSYENV